MSKAMPRSYGRRPTPAVGGGAVAPKLRPHLSRSKRGKSSSRWYPRASRLCMPRALKPSMSMSLSHLFQTPHFIPGLSPQLKGIPFKSALHMRQASVSRRTDADVCAYASRCRRNPSIPYRIESIRCGMEKLIAGAVMAWVLVPMSAHAGERVGDAGLGALSGVVVFGPVGAVAGGVVGYTAGPAISHSWGLSGSHRYHRRWARRRRY